MLELEGVITPFIWRSPTRTINWQVQRSDHTGVDLIGAQQTYRITLTHIYFFHPLQSWLYTWCEDYIDLVSLQWCYRCNVVQHETYWSAQLHLCFIFRFTNFFFMTPYCWPLLRTSRVTFLNKVRNISPWTDNFSLILHPIQYLVHKLTWFGCEKATDPWL